MAILSHLYLSSDGFGCKVATRATQPMLIELIWIFFAPVAAFKARILLPSSAITSPLINFFILNLDQHY
ncbi:Uncharacterised protein [Edwardsiella tarda]|nr:Uncharacterised protein [Edwardsiella tarda]